MMPRIAALYDIHGNLPALEAVLDDVGASGVDQIVVGGDVVPGPMPREVLAMLLALELPVRFLSGNGEREVLAMAAGGGGEALPAPFRAATRWVADELSPAERSLMADWPATLRFDLGAAGTVLCCHASPRSDVEIFTRETPESRVLPMLAGVDANVVVCGHTHMHFDRTVGPIRILNAGSVGMPFGAPGAFWLLFGPEPELRRTDYDRELAAERIRASGFPLAAEFAQHYVLHPPPEDETLRRFARAEHRAAGHSR